MTDPAQRRFLYHYNDLGLLSEFVEPNGAITKYVYDSNSYWLTQMISPRGKLWLENTYDSMGKVTAQFYNGGTFAYSYVNSVTMTPSPGLVLKYEEEVEVTNRRGFKTHHFMNEKGKPVRIEDHAGDTVEYEYGEKGEIAKFVDQEGNVTTFDYDASGNRIAVANPLGQARKRLYNSYGQIIKATDESGRETVYIYDSKGHLAQMTNPLGVSRHHTYNIYGQITETRDFDGTVWKYQYDQYGYLSSSTDPMNNVTFYNFDELGRLLDTTDARGNKASYEYGFYGVSAIVDAKNNRTEYKYDLNGNTTERKDPNGHIYKYQYDDWDNLISVEDPLGNITTYIYDAEQNISKIIDANGKDTEYVFDGLNRLEKVFDANMKVTQYVYSKVGNIEKVVNARGKEYAFLYDEIGRLMKVTNPLGYATTYTYTRTGLPKTVQKPDGQVLQVEYDDLDRLTAIIYPDQSRKSYTYDNGNRVLTMTASARQLQYEYDALGRLTKATDVFGRTVTYEYDAVGNRTGLVLPDLRKFTYQYDVLNQLSTIMTPDGGAFGFEYDAVGQRTKLTYPNGKIATFAFDELDRLTSMNNGVYSYTYQYDKTLNLKSSNAQSGLTTYNYDALDRLIEVVYPGGRHESFTYDELGNRLTRTTPEGTESYSYDDTGELLTMGTKQFKYDKNGNLVELSDGAGVMKYVYDDDNQLRQILRDSQEIAAYEYDPFGRRITGRNGQDERQYLWDGASLLSEYTASDALISLYYNGDALDEILAIQETVTHYVHTDHLGSIAAVTTATGSVELERNYDAFGKIYASVGTYGTSLGYTGRELDQATGLIYLRNRFYDPGAGRFVSEDPIRSGNNWYAYCGSNPLTFTDPFGLKYLPFNSKRDQYVTKIGPPTPVEIRDYTGRVIGYNSQAYNCHSYAWHNGQGDPTDPRNADLVMVGVTKWDNNPDDDFGGYKQLKSCDPNKIGDRVIYYYDANHNGKWDPGEAIAHSAVVTKVDKDGNTVQVTGKMGQDSLAQNHPVAPGYYPDVYDQYGNYLGPSSLAFWRQK